MAHPPPRPPLWFDRDATFRFNAPAGEYGACYAGDSLDVAFLETLIRGSPVRVVARSALAARLATPLALSRPARLLRLHSEGLVALRLPADAPHREPYRECQDLALEVWRHPDGLDGIEYRSRWDDARLCVAVFDRAADLLAPGAPARLDDLGRIRPILRRYGIRVV